MLNFDYELRSSKSVAIGGHIRPDGDCVGAVMALYHYVKNAYPQIEVGAYLEQPASFYRIIKDINCLRGVAGDEEYDLFIVLDCARDRLGFSEPLFERAKKTINIDHHISNSGNMADISVVMPEVGSTCEVLYGLMDKQHVDQEVAQAIYIGMIHDTGVFQYSNTSPQTLRVAAELIEHGFDFTKIIDKTFYEKTYMQNQLLGRALMESFLFLGGKCIVSCLDKKTMDFYGAQPKDTDGIVNQLRITRGVECAIFMYQIGSCEYKVSLRSGNTINVASVAERFGGGGHIKAAGCTMTGTMHDVINNLVRFIVQQLGEE